MTIDDILKAAYDAQERGDFARAESLINEGLAASPDHSGLIGLRDTLTRRIRQASRCAVGDTYYGPRAAEYQKRRQVTKRWGREQMAVAAMLANMPIGLSVLDIPFGTGRFVPLYLARQMQVTGIDISSGMLDEARKELGADAARCTMEVGDALRIQRPDKSFDLVVCVRFLQNIIPFRDVPQVLREIARVSKALVILEMEVRKDDSVDAGLPKDGAPMRGLLYQRQIDALLRDAGLTRMTTAPLYNNGASEYAMLLCRLIS